MSEVIVRHRHTSLDEIYRHVFDFHWADHHEVGLNYFEEAILPFELQFVLQGLISNTLVPLLHRYINNFVAKRRLQMRFGFKIRPEDRFSRNIIYYLKEKEKDPYYSNKDRRTAVLVRRKKPSELYLQV